MREEEAARMVRRECRRVGSIDCSEELGTCQDVELSGG